MRSPLKELAHEFYKRGMEGASRLARAKDAQRCQWQQQEEDGSHFVSDCGMDWEFIEGGPIDNRVRFCPGCGKKALQVLAEPDDD